MQSCEAMRLSQFILDNLEPLLERWEKFVGSLDSGRLMSGLALRGDAERMLRFIAHDIDTDQSSLQRLHKSQGREARAREDEPTAADDHGLARATDRFSLAELVAEYRAFRASVTDMWIDAAPRTYENALQLVRFNEAVDQILSESVIRFGKKLDSDADLLTASIGHDLRNPLNAVMLSAHQLATSKTLSHQEQIAAARIESSTARIAGMLQDLNDFTRTRLGSIVGYQREASSVGDVCREIIEETRASYPERTITFAELSDTTAFVDRKRIGQLLSNLVANAVQHGVPETAVSVRVVGMEQHVRIEVHNDGVIDAGDLEGIFEPLHRSPGRKPNHPGSLGLGLYIARRIAQGHGGSLDVTSTEAGGTTFVAHLPQVMA